jgi:hypothetical protein
VYREVDNIVSQSLDGISAELPRATSGLPRSTSDTRKPSAAVRASRNGSSNASAQASGSHEPSVNERLAAASADARAAGTLGGSKEVEEAPRKTGFDSSGHDNITSTFEISDAEKPFRPFSAALVNLMAKESLLSPAALASGDNLTPLQKVRLLRMASRRDPQLDLPSNVLCCKWTNGDMWAVLEANMESKDFRILYVDPFDGRQKVWSVTRTLEAYKEQFAESRK